MPSKNRLEPVFAAKAAIDAMDTALEPPCRLIADDDTI
jgi:hypothetical protein